MLQVSNAAAAEKIGQITAQQAEDAAAQSRWPRLYSFVQAATASKPSFRQPIDVEAVANLRRRPCQLGNMSNVYVSNANPMAEMMQINQTTHVMGDRAGARRSGVDSNSCEMASGVGGQR